MKFGLPSTKYAALFIAVFIFLGAAGRQAPPKSVLDLEVIPRTPERYARGKYLAEGVLQCSGCHSDFDYSRRPPRPFPGKELGGYVFPNRKPGDPTRIVASNISPDPEYGAGRWEDSDLVRALREGIGHDGRTLAPLMPSATLRYLSDEDIASTIVYLRAQPPMHMQQPPTHLSDELRKTLQPLPPFPHVPEPDRSNRVAYGKYLVAAGHCVECHATFDEKGRVIPGMEFAGGATITGEWSGPGKLETVYGLNLTPDASGIGYFDDAMFIEVMRNGGFKARPLSNIMPTGYFRNLNDDDLKAIFAYLQSLKPVRHHVDNTEPPTYCKICKKTTVWAR
jgi:mono/diheme cytochrome c family protein